MKRVALVAVMAATSFFPLTADARNGGHGASYGHSGGRSGSSVHWTDGHITKTGTYIQGHYSTNPNRTRNDNFSTRGNTNPYTGKAGVKPRDGDTN